MDAPKKMSSSALMIIFFVYGFTLTTLQIVYLRSFIALFYGNELSIGLFLFSWMLWTALGSYWSGKIKRVADYLPSHHFLFGLIIPFSLLLMLFIRLQFLPVGSALPGFGLTIFTALASLILFGLLSGGLFPLYGKLFRQVTNELTDLSGSRVYFWETSGSMLGGLLSGLILVRWLPAEHLVVGLSIVHSMLAFFFLSRTQKRSKSLIISIYFLIGFFALSSFLSGYQQRFKQLWQGMEIVAHRGSPYGDLVLTRLDHSYTLYQDGVPLFTLPDPQTAEETVHYALLLHKKPVSVLLIGGGFSGALFETLKHPSVKHVHYVELDAEVITLYQKFFPQNWQKINSDARIIIHQTDGRTFLKNSKQKFDVIIIALPDPYNVQLNRFYTREFFNLCKAKLRAGGLVAFQLSASENYLNEAQKKYLKAIKNSFEPIFKNWAFLPGEKVQLFLSTDSKPLNISSSMLIQRLNQRKLETLFVRDYFIPFKLLPDRIKMFRQAFETTPFSFYNSDLHPLAYYFDIILWTGKTSTALAHFFSELLFFPWPFFLLLFILPFFLLLFFFLFKAKATLPAVSSALGMFSVGFSMISLELLILIAFQVAHGYIYQQIAVFIALFMGGMAMGSFAGIRKISKSPKNLQLKAALVLLIIALLCFALNLIWGKIFHLLHSRTIFYLLAITSGFLGGFSFPLFNHLFLRPKEDQAQSGVIYAWDLIGSMAGSFLSSVLLIPIFGLIATGTVLGILNLMVALFTLLAFWKTKTT